MAFQKGREGPLVVVVSIEYWWVDSESGLLVDQAVASPTHSAARATVWSATRALMTESQRVWS